LGANEAIALDTVESEGSDAVRRMIAMGRLLPDLPALVVSSRGVHRVSHGNPLSPQDFEDVSAAATLTSASEEPAGAQPVRLLDEEGTLLAIAERRPGGVLHPVVVLM